MTTSERDYNFRLLNPITATTREIAEVLNRTIDGGLNSIGYVTLQANVTSTTVEDPRYNVESIVFFASQGHSGSHFNPYVDSTSTNGNLVIGHDNHGHTQRYAYLIIG